MSRRNGLRNKFKFNTNYLIPLICIIITCATIITCTLIVINIKNEADTLAQKDSLNQYVQGNSNAEMITDEQKIQINKLISFLISNLDASKDLTDEKNKFSLVIKYYLQDNESKVIPTENIDVIAPDVYRSIGYVYFEDYKEEYRYINQEDFKKTYEKLFNIENYKLENYSDYYIKNIDGFVIPKNNEVKVSSQYKVNNISIIQDSIYELKLNMVEINLYTLYETMSFEEINEYINNAQINQNSLTGNMLTIKVIKQNDKYVFNGYGKF